MRLAVAIAAALMTTASQAGWCNYLVPPAEMRQEPTVDYWDTPVSQEELRERCGLSKHPLGMAGACAVFRKSPDGDQWVIYIRDDLDEAEYECVLTHEKAHLPPNNWDHGPSWALTVAGTNTPISPGPKWRRPSHVDVFFFARGRVGNRPPEEPLPDWLTKQIAESD